MTYAEVMSFAVGAMQLVTSACILAKQVLLKPDSKNYPTAPFHHRLGLWALGAVLGYFGAETLDMAWTGQRFSRPSALVLSMVWLYAAAVEMERVFRQWLPERVHRRVQQLMHVASCHAAREIRRARIAALKVVRRDELITNPIVGSASPAAVGQALTLLVMDNHEVAGPNERSVEARLGVARARLRRRFPPITDGVDAVIPDELREVP